MRKFNSVYKEKVAEADELQEANVLSAFRKVYNSLLEHYNLTAINDLNEKSQLSFLTELNQYWTEESGLTLLGESFLAKKSLRLNENSTPLQKKNYLKNKTIVLLNETLRQNDLKYKIYSVINEMYDQIEGDEINDVLSPDMISNIIAEAFAGSLDEFVSTIHFEISDSVEVKEPEKLNESVKAKRVFVNKRK